MSTKITETVGSKKGKSLRKPSVIILCADKGIAVAVERAVGELDVLIIDNDNLSSEFLSESDIRVVIIDWRFIYNMDYSVIRSLFPDTEMILILEKPFNELDLDEAALIDSELNPSMTPHIPIEELVLKDAVKCFLEKQDVFKEFKALN